MNPHKRTAPGPAASTEQAGRSKAQPGGDAPSSHWLNRGSAFLGLMLLGLLLATFAGRLGSFHWSLDLFSHFVPWYTLLALLTLLGLILIRRWWLAAIALVVVLVNVLSTLSWFFPGDNPQAPSVERLRLMQLNVLTSNQHRQPTINLIEKELPDLILLQEVNESWMLALASALTDYRVGLSVPRDDNVGIALLVREPLPGSLALKEVRLATRDETATPLPTITIIAELAFAGRPVTLVGTHPLSPLGRDYTAYRDIQLSAVRRRALRSRGEPIVIGDLNTTPWSYAMKLVQSPAQLVSSQQGFGVQPTWPSGRGLALIPIDHCLHSPDLVTVDHRVGPHVGSDHRPLLVTLAWK